MVKLYINLIIFLIMVNVIVWGGKEIFEGFKLEGSYEEVCVCFNMIKSF